jgi:isopropylmalate/homocitrate/citramalate synthase
MSKAQKGSRGTMGREHREGLWEVSSYNFDKGIRADMNLPRRVTVMDTTLREGRQVEGVSIRPEDAIEVARRLDDAGIPMVEMHHDYLEEIETVKKLGMRFEIQALVHPTAALNPEACRHEVDLFVDSGADIVCLAFAVSDYNFGLYESMGGLKISREEALEKAAEAVRYAKTRKAKVSCNMMDFSRVELERLLKIVKTLAEAGSDIIRIDDICAPCIPAVCKHHIKAVKQVIPNTIIAMHTHDDFGLATALQLAALEGGAEILEGAFNGLGERAGIPNLAELVAILEILYGYDTGIHMEKLKSLSDFVADVYNQPIPPMLTAVGERSFSHAAEVHYVLPEGDRWSFNAWAPEVVGNKAYVALCQYSGPKAIQRKARELGLGQITDAVAAEVLEKVRSELRFRRQKLSDDLFKEMVRSASARKGK